MSRNTPPLLSTPEQKAKYGTYKMTTTPSPETKQKYQTKIKEERAQRRKERQQNRLAALGTQGVVNINRVPENVSLHASDVGVSMPNWEDPTWDLFVSPYQSSPDVQFVEAVPAKQYETIMVSPVVERPEDDAMYWIDLLKGLSSAESTPSLVADNEPPHPVTVEEIKDPASLLPALTSIHDIMSPSEATFDMVGTTQGIKATILVPVKYTTGPTPTVITEAEYAKRVKGIGDQGFYTSIRYRRLPGYTNYRDRDSWYQLVDKWVYQPDTSLHADFIQNEKQLRHFQTRVEEKESAKRSSATKRIMQGIKKIQQTNPLGPVKETQEGYYNPHSWLSKSKGEVNKRAWQLAENLNVPMRGLALDVATRGVLPPNTQAENRAFQYETEKAVNEGKSMAPPSKAQSKTSYPSKTWMDRLRWEEDLVKRSDWDIPFVPKRPKHEYIITRK